MSSLLTPAVSTKPIYVAGPSPDPWYEGRTPRATPPAWLVFGARVRHNLIPGTWKVVREPARYGNGRDYLVRVREQAADGSLFGPVLSWKVGEVAGLVTDEAEAVAKQTSDLQMEVEPRPVAARPLVVTMAISDRRDALRGRAAGPRPLRVEGVPVPSRSAATRRCTTWTRRRRGRRARAATSSSAHDGLDDLGCKHIRAARMMGPDRRDQRDVTADARPRRLR